jgi:transcriptional regulator with XRE-family HTH domain
MEEVPYPKLARLLTPLVRGRQSTVAVKCGVRQASVSKWKNGKARPELEHIAPLAKFLEKGWRVLAEAADYHPDELEVFVGQEHYDCSCVDIEELREQARDAYFVRLEGNPSRGYLMGGRLQGRLEQAEQKAAKRIPSVVRALRELRAEVMYEQGVAYLEHTPVPRLNATIHDLVSNIRSIAYEDEKPSLDGLAYSLEGILLYILNQYDAAIPKLKIAVEGIVSPGWNLFTLRTLALTYAYLGKDKDFNRVDQKEYKIVQSGKLEHPEYVYQFIEARARAQALFGGDRAFVIWEEGWKQLTSSGMTLPFRTNQYYRTRFDVIHLLQPNDKSTLETAGNEGLRFAKERGYPRYQEMFEKGLARYL